MNVDKDGNMFYPVKEFVDYERMVKSLRADDTYIIVGGIRTPKRTTKGWQMYEELVDGTTEWFYLITAKECMPSKW